MMLKTYRAPLREGRMSSTLRIEVIVFAAPPAILLVRCGYLQNAHTSDLHISQKTGAIAAGAFNANPL